MHRSTRRTVAGLALALGLAAPAARGQGIELVDPSARAGGMGGAAAAVTGAGTRDAWLNPALAATARGLSVQSGTQLLLPGLATGLQLHATALAVSYAGFALTSAGRPFGGATLVQPGIPGPPDSLGTVDAGWTETLESRGAAVSLAGIADAVWAAAGRPGAPFTRRGDVAFGRTWKRVTSNALFGQRSFSERDEGWLVRAAVLDTRRGSGSANGGLRIELSWGATTQGRDLAPPGGLAGGELRTDRTGGAVRATWWGPPRSGEPGGAWTDAFRGALSPLLDLTLAADHARFRPAGNERRPDPVLEAGWTADAYGLEATLWRVATLRAGYVDDPDGGIRKPSWGLGACLPFGRASEARYDFASVPQSYARRVYRHQVSLSFNPYPRERLARTAPEE